jgi:hypothetical protein
MRHPVENPFRDKKRPVEPGPIYDGATLCLSIVTWLALILNAFLIIRFVFN